MKEKDHERELIIRAYWFKIVLLDIKDGYNMMRVVFGKIKM